MTSVFAVLLLVAIAVAQVLFGGGDGTRLIYMLPSYLLLGVAGVLAIFSFRRLRKSACMDAGCLLSVAALSIYLLVRMALSPVESLARVDFLVLLASLLVYFITARCVKTTEHRVAIVITLLVIALGHVAVGVIQFAKDSNFHPIAVAGRGDLSSRASGLFISANHLAGFLEVAFLLGVSLCFWGGFRATVRVVIAYLTLACLAGIVLTGSRGGYLSTATGLGALVMMSFWSARSAVARPTLALVIGIVVIVAIIGGVIAFVTERSYAINARANSVFVSTDIRLQLWDAALKQFQLAPVFGTGSRTYLYHGRTFRGPGVHTDPIFAHSDYLQTLAEYGAVGLMLFAGFIAFHLRNGWHGWHSIIASMARYRLPAAERNALALQIGCMAALVAYLVHSALDFNLHIPANALLIALVFGMLATCPAAPEDAPQPRWAWMPAALVPLLGIWMIEVGAPKVAGELFVEQARMKLVAGKPSDALKDTARALEWGTRNPEVHYYIGEANRLISARFTDPVARSVFLRAAHKGYADGLALFPQDVRLVLMTAWSLQRLGRLDESATLLARAAELDPNWGDVWLYHSMQEKYLGHPAEALAYYQKAASLGCDIPSVMRVLGEQLDPQELQKAAARAQPAPAGEQ